MALFRKRIRIVGKEKLNRALRRLARRSPQKLGAALFVEGELIMTASKRIVPVDLGALRASGIVRKPDVSTKRVTVTLAYGGTAAPYAVIVHENPNAMHNAPTRFKYLEEPFNEALTGLATRVGRVVKRAMENDARRQ